VSVHRKQVDAVADAVDDLDADGRVQLFAVPSGDTWERFRSRLVACDAHDAWTLGGVILWHREPTRDGSKCLCCGTRSWSATAPS
jgi:hypothetical protein